MSIFKKASELDKLPGFVSNAYFEDHEIKMADEFENLFKEASSSKQLYQNRVADYKSNTKKAAEFSAPQPSFYEPKQYDLNKPGIRRAGYGKRFDDEQTMFNSSDRLRNTELDQRFANARELSIWDTEFDDIAGAFKDSQEVEFSNKRTVMAKKESNKSEWEQKQLTSIRAAKVLPYRGLGVTRSGGEVQHESKFGSVNEYYAEAQDSIREMIRVSNRERKSMIERQGVDPDETRSDLEIKEKIQARTLENINKTSFLASFADKISSHDL